MIIILYVFNYLIITMLLRFRLRLFRKLKYLNNNTYINLLLRD